MHREHLWHPSGGEKDHSSLILISSGHFVGLPSTQSAHHTFSSRVRLGHMFFLFVLLGRPWPFVAVQHFPLGKLFLLTIWLRNAVLWLRWAGHLLFSTASSPDNMALRVALGVARFRFRAFQLAFQGSCFIFLSYFCRRSACMKCSVSPIAAAPFLLHRCHLGSSPFYISQLSVSLLEQHLHAVLSSLHKG